MSPASTVAVIFHRQISLDGTPVQILIYRFDLRIDFIMVRDGKFVVDYILYRPIKTFRYYYLARVRLQDPL